MTDREALLIEEADFWRRFVADWKRDRAQPVPPRMLEMHARAERRLRHYLAMAQGECPTIGEEPMH